MKAKKVKWIKIEDKPMKTAEEILKEFNKYDFPSSHLKFLINEALQEAYNEGYCDAKNNKKSKCKFDLELPE